MAKQFVAAVLCLGLAATSAAQAPVAAKPAPPPNGPARVTVSGRTITVRYDGATILTAEVTATRGVPTVRQLVDTANGRVTQVVSWVSGAGRYTLRGTVHTTGEALAVDADPREDGVPVVRHSVGPSYNQLNRAVYARDRDWLLSVDFPASARITPVAGGDSAAFELVADGYEITLRFRPRFYQKHRGLAPYEPWAYRTWPRSVAGWTSWFAFKDRVTEADIQRTADVMAERLKPYGYDVLQIDDGFQRSPISVPDNWLNTNAKFPSGLGGLQRYIAGKGLTAGLWTNTAFHDSAWAYAHPQYFVRDAAGKPSRGNWVGYVMDGSPATMRDLVLPVYAALKRQGWGYYKVDALRHLRYEGFNSHSAYFAQRTLDRVKVYRDFTQQIRTVIGRDAFLLASWGPRPELVGIIDATRLGDDGFGYGGFAQFNSFNNVVWRNDPDHIELSQPDGRRAATLTSLTGSLLMLTDKPETYHGAALLTAQRTAPVLVTRPGQVYDVDPSRTDRLWMVESEVSGAGPRPFEADQRLQQTFYQTDIARPFERWTVLARTAGAPTTIAMEELGLDTARVYVAFDYWNDQALGAIRSSLALEPVTGDAVQVVCLRERVDHPQLLSTNRHVTCGGADLQDVRWEGSALRGISSTVAGDALEIAVTEPPGWEAIAIESPDARAQLGERVEPAGPNGVRWRRVVLAGPATTLRWTVRFRQTP
ncbi:MAG TPA: alpha-galactosidase [Gemmatimonadaceae bacterium]|jgi:alpha-galactosidase